MSKKPILFDRNGNCPICHNEFRSEHCPHSFAYVESVVHAANSNFIDDVKRVKGKTPCPK